MATLTAAQKEQLKHLRRAIQPSAAYRRIGWWSDAHGFTPERTEITDETLLYFATERGDQPVFVWTGWDVS